MSHNEKPIGSRERSNIVSAIWTSTNYVGENDAIVNFFSREIGALSTKAKGLKKPTSKLSPLLQTGDELSINLASGRGSNPILTGVKILNSHPLWRSSLDYAGLAWFMGECAVLATSFEEENSKAYMLIVNLFRSKPDLTQIFGCGCVFCLKFLHIHGLLASIYQCAVCGDHLSEGKPAYILPDGEGVACQTCFSPSSAKEAEMVVQVSSERLARWRSLLGGKLLTYENALADKVDFALLLHMTCMLIENTSGRRVGSIKFLRTQWNLAGLDEP